MQKSLDRRTAEGAIVIGSWLTFVILAIGARERTVLPGDLRLAIWVQSWHISGLDQLTAVTNRVMGGWILTIWTVALSVRLLIRHEPRAALFLAATIVVRFGNSLIKHIVHSPRPTPDLIHVTHTSDGYGFPSGHTVGAVAVGIAVAWIDTRHYKRAEARVMIWFGVTLVIVITAIGTHPGRRASAQRCHRGGALVRSPDAGPWPDRAAEPERGSWIGGTISNGVVELLRPRRLGWGGGGRRVPTWSAG